MLKEIILETLGIKNVEEGELITPIDTYTSKNCFQDVNLTKKIKGSVTFKKGDELEVQVVTPHEIVAYNKDKDLYVVIDKRDFSEFEDIA